MLQVADYMEEYPEGFDMASWGPSACKSIGCISGYVEHMQRCGLFGKLTDKQRGSFVAGSGGPNSTDLLDITSKQALSLFTALGDDDGVSVWDKYWHDFKKTANPPTTYFVTIGAIRADMAITMLRNLASGKWTF